MPELLRLVVLTPVSTLLDAGDVKWVQLRLADGAGIGIFPGHAPLLAETVAAPLRYADANGEHILNVDAGILRVANAAVTLFTSGLRDQVAALSPWDMDEKPHFERLFHALAAANTGPQKKRNVLLRRISTSREH